LWRVLGSCDDRGALPGAFQIILVPSAIASPTQTTPPPPANVAAADATSPRPTWLTDYTPSPATSQPPARADSTSSSTESVNEDEDDPDFDDQATAAEAPDEEEGDIVMADKVLPVDDVTADAVVIVDGDAEAAPLASDAPLCVTVLLTMSDRFMCP